MLSEIYDYLTTATNAEFKKLGFLKESIAIQHRYKRVHKNWDAHVRNTKAFILDSIEGKSKKNEIIVLGSGALIDVPIEALCESFKKVILVDVIHPKTVVKLSKKNTAIQLIEADVSGLSKKYRKRLSPDKLPYPEPICPGYSEDTDFVLSVNLLSQLPVVFKSHLRYATEHESQVIDKWCQSIIHSHVKMITELECDSCLISDVKHIYECDSEEPTESSSVYEYTMPEPDKSWTWDIAPPGELAKGSLRNVVNAYKNIHLS